ncbi:MAG: alpha/beta hydrolase [Gammaproteobacteria bacterium]|nr:alpha/beta hydrolase [Gammaproteobacteria bacterium]
MTRALKVLAAAGLLLGTTAFAPAAVAATPVGQPVVIAQSYTLVSKTLKETRRYNVMLPPGYEQSQDAYPILILLDGGIAEDFHHMSGIVQVSVGNGTMRPFIVVGIENTQRRRDFTPHTDDPEDKKVAPVVGGAAQFRRFLAEELLPTIRRDYRTTAETAIAGESFAGLFIVDTLLRQPELFDSYIAVSPSLWWNKEYVNREGRALLAGKSLKDKKVFLTMGDATEGMQDSVGRTAALLKDRTQLVFAPLPEESHATILHGAAFKAFRTLLAPQAKTVAGD